jgi:hypothetical protein
MRESRSYGSVRGALSNERPYRDRDVARRAKACVPTICLQIALSWWAHGLRFAPPAYSASRPI